MPRYERLYPPHVFAEGLRMLSSLSPTNHHKQTCTRFEHGITLVRVAPNLSVVRDCDPAAGSDFSYPFLVRTSVSKMVTVRFNRESCCNERFGELCAQVTVREEDRGHALTQLARRSRPP